MFQRLFGGGVAAALAAMGFGGFTAEDAEAKKCKKKCKKKKTAKKRRKCRKKCNKPTPPTCNVCASGCDFTSVQAAIDAAASGATIKICAGTFTENLTITKDLTLIGRGDGDGAGDTILKGAGSGSVVSISKELDPHTVALRQLRITGGTGMDNDAFGGGVNNDGGTLTLNDCTITGNTANFAGGGIHNDDGELTLIDCVVSGNVATDLSGGGILNFGGAVTLNNTEISGNAAGQHGGGIVNQAKEDAATTVPGSLTLVGSSVTGNSSAGDGGGIQNEGGSTLTLLDSSVTGNFSAGDGGGIYNEGDDTTVSCDSINSVTGNTSGDPPEANNCIDNIAGSSGCNTCSA